MKKATILKSNDGNWYRVYCHLGKGTFGEVFICRDINSGDFFAVKISRSIPEYIQQGNLELSVLRWIQATDATDEYHLLRLSDYLFLHNHHCFITPLYSFTLLDLMQNNVQGLSFPHIRLIATSVCLLPSYNV